MIRIALICEAFAAILRKGTPLFTSAPPHVLEHLASCPERVPENAWLVMFYGIMLTVAMSDPSYSELTRAKLSWNLRQSVNDAKLLLEPSDCNIQALTLLACHVQEFSTPSLCWMTIASACRMLQALGITTQMVDPKTRERRVDLFWTLNVLDKTLALLFGRPPTFHRAMCDEIPMPPLERLLPYRPHYSTTTLTPDTPTSLFGAHYMRQMYLLSKILSELWCCLYEDRDGRPLATDVKQRLEDWYNGAVVVTMCSLRGRIFC